jgi:hypothetical protein
MKNTRRADHRKAYGTQSYEAKNKKRKQRMKNALICVMAVLITKLMNLEVIPK